ncbi:MAG: hypothetical protein LBD59_03865 [Prevotellaceae bacterium]|nr:hypothetical protein [Prevotellaceae bacterium]
MKKNKYKIQNTLYFINSVEKEKYNDYDVIVVYWSKKSYSIGDIFKTFKKNKFMFNCSLVNKCNSNDILEQTEENLLLNETEGAYLNKIFETARNDFDFVNKEIGFLTGSSGTKKSSKELYFDMHEKHSTNANSPCDNGTLYIFTATQIIFTIIILQRLEIIALSCLDIFRCIGGG